MIPECPWRFGERYLATDFVQVNNIAILEKAHSLYVQDNDTFIQEVANYVRDEFYYPLDNSGNPAASGQLLRHGKGLMSYHFKHCVYYAWSFPNEAITAGCGICIDTAHLATSLLRAKENPDTWVVLGDVLAVDGTLLGRHAWTAVPYKKDIYVLETTVHDANVNNMIKASEVYDKTSDWAQRNGLYYSVQAKYNESEFVGEGPLAYAIIQIMGLPMKEIELWGLDGTLRIKGKKLNKEWRREEIVKQKAILEAFS